jgi:phosphatidylglycerophosphate synthase
MASVVFARLIEPVLSVADWSLLALVLAVLAVLINATAVQRALYVWRALSEREEARHAS